LCRSRKQVKEKIRFTIDSHFLRKYEPRNLKATNTNRLLISSIASCAEIQRERGKATLTSRFVTLSDEAQRAAECYGLLKARKHLIVLAGVLELV